MIWGPIGPCLGQLALLGYAAWTDIRSRTVTNRVLLAMAAATAAGMLFGMQPPDWRNLALPAVAIVSYRLSQVGGGDAKALLAVSWMPGPWVFPFLVAAFLNAAALHAVMRRPPLMVAIGVAYATVWVPTLAVYVVMG